MADKIIFHSYITDNIAPTGMPGDAFVLPATVPTVSGSPASGAPLTTISVLFEVPGATLAATGTLELWTRPVGGNWALADTILAAKAGVYSLLSVGPPGTWTSPFHAYVRVKNVAGTGATGVRLTIAFNIISDAILEGSAVDTIPLAGDVTGTLAGTTVAAITGTAGTVTLNATLFKPANLTVGNGVAYSFLGQATSAGGSIGGNVIIDGGTGVTRPGSVILRTGGTDGFRVESPAGVGAIATVALALQLQGTNPAAAGDIRGVTTRTTLATRNAANSGDNALVATDASDNVIVNATGFMLKSSSVMQVQGNSTGLGFNNATPVAKPTFAANATDLATAITLVNDLKARLIAYGLGA